MYETILLLCDVSFALRLDQWSGRSISLVRIRVVIFPLRGMDFVR